MRTALLLVLILLAGCQTIPMAASPATPSVVPITHTALPPSPTSALPTTLPQPTPATANVVVLVEVSATELQVGESATVTVTLRYQLPPECSYPLYDVTLEQAPADPELMRYDTPKRLGPPGPNPAIYQVTALAPGTLHFRGLGYGELNCGNGWSWNYHSGESVEVTILPTKAIYLPITTA